MVRIAYAYSGFNVYGICVCNTYYVNKDLFSVNYSSGGKRCRLVVYGVYAVKMHIPSMQRISISRTENVNVQ